MAAGGFSVRPFPGRRAVVLDTLSFWARRNVVHGLIEADVTDILLHNTRERAAGREGLSLTAVLISCMARAVAAEPEVQGIRTRRGLVVYEDVDVATVVERRTAQGAVPVSLLVRGAQLKDAGAIQEELREVQRASGSAGRRPAALYRGFLRAPRLLRGVMFRLLARDAAWVKGHLGTVGVSAVGMFAGGGGWAVPVSVFPVFLTVGGIQRKPAMTAGSLELRDYVCLTLTFDHDIVDGGPAARFVARLRELVEQTNPTIVARAPA